MCNSLSLPNAVDRGWKIKIPRAEKTGRGQRADCTDVALSPPRTLPACSPAREERSRAKLVERFLLAADSCRCGLGRY